MSTFSLWNDAAMSERFDRLKIGNSQRGAGRTRSIGTHVTPEEYEQIQAHCAACGKDVSTMTREIWLKQIRHPAIDPSTVTLRLFVGTFEGLLRLGDGFTVEQFRQICAAAVKGHVSQQDLDKILGSSEEIVG
jgi:hypothetical protein